MRVQLFVAMALLAVTLAYADSDATYADILHGMISAPALKPFGCLGKYLDGERAVHSADCHKFLNCVRGRLIEMDCPPGTYFEDSTRNCEIDHKKVCASRKLVKPKAIQQNVTIDCGNNNTTQNVCLNQTNGYAYADTANCANYYMCSNNESLVQTCPIGNWFNPVAQICLPDTYAQCLNPCANFSGPVALPSPNIQPNQCPTYFYCVNYTTIVENCTVNGFDVLTGTCSTNPTCVSDMCIGVENYVTFPVVNAPSNFIICVNDEPEWKSCNENEVFDPVLLICMVAVRSRDCDQSFCRSASNAGQAFRTSSGYDDMFCVCRYGVAYVESCPEDYIFDVNDKQCVSSAACDPDYCIDKPDYRVTKNRHDPSAFCFCVSQTVQEVRCPSHGTFNPYSGYCQKSSLCDLGYCSGKEDGKIFPAQEDNVGFCLCMNGATSYMPCPDGATFNPGLKLCVKNGSSSAKNVCDARLCAKSGQTIHPANNDRSSFCYCTSPTRILQRACPADTQFDTSVMMCLSKNTAKTTDAIGCDIEACAQARDGRTYPIAAHDTKNNFCYCLGVDKMISLYCPAGKRFNERLGVCFMEQDILDTSLAVWNAADLANCAGGVRHGEFAPHESDCERFYICNNGRLHVSECGAGNYFDEFAGACAWDRRGICSSGKGAGCMDLYSEGEAVAHSRNSQLFFICYNQILQPQDCGNNNIFDAKLSACVPAGGAQKSSFSLFARSRPVESAGANGAVEKEFHCNEGDKRSVPSNCSQYEICTAGAWYRHSCRQQRYYNPEQQKCLEPRDDRICTYARVADMPLCHNATEHQTVAPKNGKCGNYFRCTQSKWTLWPCPKGEYYAQQLNTCIATKRKTEVCLATNATVTANTTESMGELTVIGKTTRCRHTAVRRYPSNCGMYLMCMEGDWWQEYCALGMYFNQTLNTCLPLDGTEVNCGLLANTPPKVTAGNCSVPLDPHGICADWQLNVTCVHGEKRVFPLNCTAFEECGTEGHWQRTNCATGWAFDDSLLECVPQSDYVLCGANGLRKICTQGTSRILPLSNNHSLFYYCEEDTWRVGSCLANHTYVSAMAACVPVWDRAVNYNVTLNGTDSSNQTRIPIFEATTPTSTTIWDVDSTDSSTITEITETMDPREINDIIDSTTISTAIENANEFTNTTTNTSTTENSVSLSCENQHGVLLRDSSNCNDFYVCLNGKPRHETCYDGYFFNATMQQCQRLASVQMNSTAICMDQRRNLTELCTQLPSGATMAVAGDCRRYTSCQSREAPLSQRCRNGENYDSLLGICRQTDGTCLLENGQRMGECNERHGQLLANMKNCRSYYVCLGEQKIELNCAANEYFDGKQLQCARDVLKQCTAKASATRIGIALSCVGLDVTKLYANVADQCRSYYRCIDSQPYLSTCPQHLYFDERSGACVDASLVTCDTA